MLGCDAIVRFASLPIGIVVVDPSYCIVTVNGISRRLSFVRIWFLLYGVRVLYLAILPLDGRVLGCESAAHVQCALLCLQKRFYLCQGETLSFGKVNVNIQGVNNGKEMIPWDQIDAIETRNGLIVVQKYGRVMKWSTVRERETPNVYVLQNLVDYAIKNR
jgi:hypothetical protein